MFHKTSSKVKRDDYLSSKLCIQTPSDVPRSNVDRRSSSSASHSQSSFGDALDAGRGMVAMSQDLTTPRNVYGSRGDRDSADSYGFPSSHSSHSSISSASSYPSFYGSSVDGSSVSDYSSQSEMEPISSRTLPRPSGLVGANLPPAPPQSMMGQFNSKISSSTQKKHKCRVCDKRFTRPSSLQTHSYSHTGEKRKWSQVESIRSGQMVDTCDSIRLRCRRLRSTFFCCFKSPTTPQSTQGRSSIKRRLTRRILGIRKVLYKFLTRDNVIFASSFLISGSNLVPIPTA